MKYLLYVPLKFIIAMSAFGLAGLYAGYRLRAWRTLAVCVAACAVSLAAYGIITLVPGFTFLGAAPERAETSSKLVALTFDDGPSPMFTPPILDALKSRHTHATFFIQGKHAARTPALVRRIAREGHEIGNHTYHHPLLLSLGNSARRREIQSTTDAIFAASGARVKYYRSPYEYRDFRLLRLLRSMGLQYVGHSISPRDVFGTRAENIAAWISSHASPGAIILLHDAGGNRTETARALPLAIDQLNQKGYTAVTLSELFAAK